MSIFSNKFTKNIIEISARSTNYIFRIAKSEDKSLQKSYKSYKNLELLLY